MLFGDDEELEEEQYSEEGEDDEVDLEENDEDDAEDPDQAPEEEAELRSTRRFINPDESEITHAVDCPLDETCSCGDAE